MTGDRQPLSREELTEWLAFWQLEPFGAAFEEYLSAMQAAVVAEVNRDRKKRARAFGAKDFIQDWDKAAEKSWSVGVEQGQSAEHMYAFIKQVQAEIEAQHGIQRTALVDPYGRPIDSGEVT